MSERISIGRINGAEIYAVRNENGETYVPIKPICEAIGVSFQGQHLRLKEDPLLSSTINLRLTVGADGKDREMVCLPLEYVYGWIFRIDSRNVKEESMQSVLEYQKECYDALYRHFFCQSQRQIETNKEEIKTLEKLTGLLSEEKSIKGQIKETRDHLSKIRAARLDPNPSLFD